MAQLVAYISGGGLWLRHLDGSGARELATPWPISEIQWSPDGAELAVEAASCRIAVIDPATGHSQVLEYTRQKMCSRAWVPAMVPSWSPNSRYLAFAKGMNSGSMASLWLWDHVTRSARLLVSDWSTTYFMTAAWSHDSTRLAVAVGPSSVYGPGLHSTDPTLDVLNIVRGTAYQIGSGAAAAWSPDDRLLSFVHYKGCGNTWCAGDTKVIPLAGGTVVLLTGGETSEFTTNEWVSSPLGYAFDRWVLDRQGHIVRRIAGGGERVHWAPDGRYAVVESYRSSQNGGVFDLSLMSLTGLRTPIYSPGGFDTIHAGYVIAWQHNSKGFAFVHPSSAVRSNRPRSFVYSIRGGSGAGALRPIDTPGGITPTALSFTADDRDLLVAGGTGSYSNYSNVLYRYNIQAGTFGLIASNMDVGAFALQPVAPPVNLRRSPR